MASILKNIVERDIREPLLVSTFHRIEMLLLDPIQYCSSEYHLINWLTKKQ